MVDAINIQNVSKSYGKLQALDTISFSIKKGEFFGFLGPNGAGKTTTINLITGLANLNQGSISVLGHDVVTDYRAARRAIGLSPQEFNFDVFLKVSEILMYQGGYYGVPATELQPRVKKLLTQFELYDKRDVKAQKLSGGMKRRLTIARALVHNPEIVILDEPTAGVDVELRHELWKFISELNKNGTTIMLTTHYIEEAEKLCDRLGVINKGKMIQVDKKTALMEKFAKSTITITLEKKIKNVPSFCKQFNVKLHNGTKLVFLEPESKMRAILRSLETNGISVAHIDIDKDNLEDIFLNLTKK